MENDPRETLLDLLSDWEISRNSGASPDASEICKDHLELLPRFQEEVKKLELKEEKENMKNKTEKEDKLHDDQKKTGKKDSDEKASKSGDKQKPPAKINLQLEEQEGMSLDGLYH